MSFKLTKLYEFRERISESKKFLLFNRKFFIRNLSRNSNSVILKFLHISFFFSILSGVTTPDFNSCPKNLRPSLCSRSCPYKPILYLTVRREVWSIHVRDLYPRSLNTKLVRRDHQDYSLVRTLEILNHLD